MKNLRNYIDFLSYTDTFNIAKDVMGYKELGDLILNSIRKENLGADFSVWFSSMLRDNDLKYDMNSYDFDSIKRYCLSEWDDIEYRDILCEYLDDNELLQSSVNFDILEEIKNDPYRFSEEV